MSDFDFTDVHTEAAGRLQPFLEELAARSPANIVSTYVTGSAVTPDFNPPTSDVNSLLVLDTIQTDFLDLLAQLGRKHGKRGVRAPLLMTRDYIGRSLDVFPIEFLDLQLVSRLVTGEEVLADLSIDRKHMRLQCERELKGRLITLRQGYIRSLGDRRLLRELLVGSLAGLVPLLRGVLFAMDRPAPRDRAGIFDDLQETARLQRDSLDSVIRLKVEQLKPSAEELGEIFDGYYSTISELASTVDAI